jgi:hypothetical protein
VGALVTAGDPLGGAAATFGVDGRFGSPQALRPGHSGYLWTYVLGTTGDEGRGRGPRLRCSRRRRSHAASGTTSSSSASTRTSTQRWASCGGRASTIARWEARYTWRADDAASWLRSYGARVAPTWTHDRAGDEDALALPVQLFDVLLASDDRFELEVHHISEDARRSVHGRRRRDDRAGLSTTMRRWCFEFESNDRRRRGCVGGRGVGRLLRRYGASGSRLEPLWIPRVATQRSA